MCTVLKSVVYLEYMKDKSVQPPILACRYNSIFLKVFLCIFGWLYAFVVNPPDIALREGLQTTCTTD